MSAEFTVEVRVNEYVYRGDRDDKLLLKGFTVRGTVFEEVVAQAAKMLEGTTLTDVATVTDKPMEGPE